jgi:hypothetical protein
LWRRGALQALGALSTVSVRHSTNNDFQIVANNRIGAFEHEGSDD